MSENAIPAEIEAFRQARHATVTGPLGDAALVGTFWITEPTELEAFPGLWELDANDPTTLRYTAPHDGTVRLGDVPAAGSLVVAPAASQEGAVLQSGALRATVLRWPGLGLAVRLWNAAEAANLVAIETYPYDGAWRFEGDYKSYDRTVDYAYHGHGGRSEGRHVVGEVAFTIAGRDYRLLVTRNAVGLTVVFGDATNGRETYAGGRFVAVHDKGARAVIDFNQATLPPCAFSPHFDCPLPPAQNVIRDPVPAGEKRIVKR